MMKSHRTPSLLRRLSACVVFLMLGVLCATSHAQTKPSISADKAKWMGYVEDYFMNNYRDITMRKSIAWGDPAIDDKGNVSIIYKWEALIWDKDRVIVEKRFTFDKDGKFIETKEISREVVAAPQDVEPKDITQKIMESWVENFFSRNFRDVTARKTLKYSNMTTNDDGTYSIDYQYEATIWDKDKKIIEQQFTFDKKGGYIGHKTLETKPLTATAIEKAGEKTGEKPQAVKLPPAAATPLVLRMLPANGDEDVDPNTPFLMVRFNQKMDGGMSWCQSNPDTFPKPDNEYKGAKWLEMYTVNLIPVRLEPNKTYVIGLNRRPFVGFKSDASGKPLPAYFTYTFKTSNKPIDPKRRAALGDEMKRAIKDAPTDPALPALLQLQRAGIEFDGIAEINATQRKQLGADLDCPLAALYNTYLGEGNAQVNVVVLEKADNMDGLKERFVADGQREENIIQLSPTILLELVPRRLPAEKAEEIRTQLRQAKPPEEAKNVKTDPAASKKKAQEGWQLFMKGKAADAEPLFAEATRLDPKNANAWQGLGWAQWSQGNGEAKASFETCLSLDAKNVAALNGLGQIALADGDEEKAIEHWQQAIKIDPRAGGPLFGLAKLYESREDYANAIKYYELCAKAEPNNAEVKAALKDAKEKAKK